MRLFLCGVLLYCLTGCAVVRSALEAMGISSPEEVEGTVRTATGLLGGLLPGWAQPLLAAIPPVVGKLSQKVFDVAGRDEVESELTSEEL